MQTVGLTHGGFYNHFASRAELLGEALERALSEGHDKARAHSRGRSDASVDRTRAAEPLAAYVRGYLSRAHRDGPGSGCAIAALLSDVGRADPGLRGSVEERIEGFVEHMVELLGEDGDQRAIVAVAAMVGALGMARIMTDRERSDAVLKAVREFVVGLESGQ
jgi:TetR/AcrR family transcriptional repressor of nem operon